MDTFANSSRVSSTRGAPPRSAGPDTPLEPVPVEAVALINRTWLVLRDNLGLVAAMMVILVVTQALPGLLTHSLRAIPLTPEQGGLAWVVAVGVLGSKAAGWVLNLWLTMGSVRICTRLARGQAATLGMLFGESQHLLTAAGASIAFTAVTVAGGFLFVVPGVVLTVGLQYFLYLIVDRDVGVVEALLSSWRLTDGYKLRIFLAQFVMMAVLFGLSCLTLGLAVLLALPTVVLFQGVAYQALLGTKHSNR